MTPFQEMYGWTFRPARRQVIEETMRVLAALDAEGKLVECSGVLDATYSFFGKFDLVHDATIEGWTRYYSGGEYRTTFSLYGE